MKWTNKGHQFDDVATMIFEYVGEYYIWGAAISGKRFYTKFQDKLNIKGFIDNDITKKKWCEKDVVQFDAQKCRGKIIVASKFYNEIKKELNAASLVENVDFMRHDIFESVYDLYRRNCLTLERVDISVTDKCTLKCKNCNMFMPYYTKPSHISYEEFCQRVDIFFSKVDYVHNVNLLGGEPFLHKKFQKMLDYLATQYSGQVSTLTVFTNASIVPDVACMESLKKHKVNIQITDYTPEKNYSERLQLFVQKVEEYGLYYRYYELDNWVDFGFPQKPSALKDPQAIIERFHNCFPAFRGLYLNRLYFCHVNASAMRANLYPACDDDYIVLDDSVSKTEVLEFNLGYSNRGYPSLCKDCKGCGSYNTDFVRGGIQMEKYKKYAK